MYFGPCVRDRHATIHAETAACMMALVTYSDSEGSGDEQRPEIRPGASKRSNPAATAVPHLNKIKVNLPQLVESSNHEDEPAAKRPRIGAGAFSDFNSMLPAPKRDNPITTQNGNKTTARKVFSLKTGAEAAFSRDLDAELRNTFAEQNDLQHDEVTTSTIPSPKRTPFAKPAPPAASNSFMFKPLSVARNVKKKKPINNVTPQPSVLSQHPEAKQSETQTHKQKISLFTTHTEHIPNLPRQEDEDDVEADAPVSKFDEDEDSSPTIPSHSTPPDSQSLDVIASDLGLSKAERRQLFGRNSSHEVVTHNIINFNTDAEYAANQQLLAQGETAQHNPVRGIAPGKHSLRQLVNAASGQKEALEESFAQGKRNKKEAGNKYGW